jgi:hypothetical protein
MHNRLIMAGLAATGGLLTTAFLQVAVATADVDVSATGADAFTVGGYTFDPLVDPFGSPGVEGWDLVAPLEGSSPLLTLGGGTVLGFFPLASQNLEVYSPAGADLGSVDTNETVASLFGLTNAEFTVVGDTAAAGGSDSALPTVGSVYDEFNLGNGYENVYTDIVSATGGPDTVSDTLVTPNGDYNLDSLFGSIDASAPMQPGDAFTGLEVGNINAAADAFSIGGFTLDPTLAAGGEGFDGVTPLASLPPLLELGGSSLGNPADAGNDFATQSFDVYSGSGSTATDIGSITTGEDVTDLLGLTNTQLIVTGATAADGGSAADLPTVGSVYDAFNLGNGYENVYTAIPGVDGANDTVSDTLVTPFGNVNLDSLFGSIDAAAQLQPGDAFTGLQAGDGSIGADAFTIGGTTFDPITAAGGEGFDPTYSIIGAPPLLEIGGGTVFLAGPGSLPLSIDQQDFNVYNGTTEVGSIEGNEDVTQLLGLTNTEFTVAGFTGTSPDLPTEGSVYDVFNIGGGIENVYTAIPGVDGGADTVTDTLVTPFGNLNLDSLVAGIDAVSALNPGDAFGAAVDAGSAATTAIDPLAFLGL